MRTLRYQSWQEDFKTDGEYEVYTRDREARYDGQTDYRQPHYVWEHNPPHVHAITQDFDAPFLIATGEIMEGEFPQKAKALVKEIILKNQNDLLEMWKTEKYKKLPPLD